MAQIRNSVPISLENPVVKVREFSAIMTEELVQNTKSFANVIYGRRLQQARASWMARPKKEGNRRRVDLRS